MRKLISDIVIGERFRRDLGDLSSLAESMRNLGQLTPITITADGQLIAGHRRIEALKMIGELAVEVHVVSTLTDAVKVVEAERDENTERKPMTGSELTDLAAALARLKRPEAKAANGRRTDLRPELGIGPVRVDVEVGKALGVGKSTAQDLIRIGEAAQSGNVEKREAGQRAQAQLDAGKGVQSVARNLREALKGNHEAETDRQSSIDRRRQDRLWRNLGLQARGLAMAIPDLAAAGKPTDEAEAGSIAADLRKLRTVISQTIDALEGKATR